MPGCDGTRSRIWRVAMADGGRNTDDDATMTEWLSAGTLLPPYTVSARMPAEPSENQIHQDGLAREMGFRGGLVPGVTVYAWMTHPVVAALGPAWLERGGFSVRFTKPVYFDEPVSVR